MIPKTTFHQGSRPSLSCFYIRCTSKDVDLLRQRNITRCKSNNNNPSSISIRPTANRKLGRITNSGDCMLGQNSTSTSRHVSASKRRSHLAAQSHCRGEFAEYENLYNHALTLARSQRYDEAREIFEILVTLCPSWHKPWVSYAQMEKRCNIEGNKNDSAKQSKWCECRKILQRALTQNPNCPRVIQAWGLLELQKGNFWPAVQMLERCVMQDPFLAPVLNWKPVKEAKSVIYKNQNL